MIALRDIVHDEINTERFLEHILHTDNEWVIHLQQYQFLEMEILYRIMLYHDILPDTLHCVSFPIGCIFNQIHFSKRPLPDDLLYFEVVKGNQLATGSLIKGLRSIHSI